MRVLTWNIHGARDAPIGVIAAEIREHGPDVVCLNEVRRRHGRRLGRALGMRSFVASSFLAPYGNAIFTNEAVTAWRRLRFDGVSHLHRRDAAVLRLASGPSVVALHLDLRPAERRHHVAQLLEQVDDDTIVAGDTNETPDDQVWEMLAARFEDAGAADPSPTFPATAPRARIDYIWVPRDATVLAYRVGASSASDHLPVMVDLA